MGQRGRVRSEQIGLVSCVVYVLQWPAAKEGGDTDQSRIRGVMFGRKSLHTDSRRWAGRFRSGERLHDAHATQGSVFFLRHASTISIPRSRAVTCPKLEIFPGKTP
jgi:hypothetical protein